MLDALLNALLWFAGVLKTLLGYVLDGFFYVLKGIIWLFVSGVLTTFKGFFDAISFSEVAFSWTAAFGQLPTQAIYCINAAGIPEMITLIAAGWGIRFLINLIPSWITRA